MIREGIAAFVALSASCTGALAADSTKILSPAARAITASGEKPYDKTFDPMLQPKGEATAVEEHGDAPELERIGEPAQ